MKSLSHFRKRRASVLFAVLAILIFAALGVLMTTTATTAELRSARRSFDRMQAFYAAEAGVQRCIQWFNQPSTAPSTLAVRAEDGESLFDEEGNSIVASTWTATDDDLMAITAGSDGKELARVVEMEISPPGADGSVAIVRATGETPTGVRATVTVALNAPNPGTFLIPAALMTEGLAASGGHFDVHWGEIWGQGDINAPQNWDRWSQSTVDPWFKVKAEGHIRSHTGSQYADGREGNGTAGKDDGFVDTAIVSSAVNYTTPFLQSSLAKYKGKYKNSALLYRENIVQHQTLPWPDFSYATIKAMVLDSGFSYFKVTEDGQIYDPITRQTRSFENTFSRIVAEGVDNSVEITDPDDIPRDTMPPLIFIDTPTGVSPEEWVAEHGALPAIELAGQSDNFYYGMFFMAADFVSKGQGDGHTYDAPEKPDMTSGDPIDIMAYGLMLTYGKMTVTGNPGMYGAVYATEGFDGGGYWRVYYDHRLNEERRMSVDWRVTASLWDVK